MIIEMKWINNKTPKGWHDYRNEMARKRNPEGVK